MDDSNSCRGGQNLERAIGGIIINKKDFVLVPRVIQIFERIDALTQEGFAIKHGNNDRESHRDAFDKANP